MIRRAVSAALLVRDGFSGAVLGDGSGTRCILDGRPVRPIWKRDGYLVLTDLESGEHSLTLQRQGYLDETVLLNSRRGSFREGTVSLKPGPGYRFPAGTARLTLSLTREKNQAVQAGTELWIGISGALRLKLAQDKSQELTEIIRVFYQGAASQYPAPGWFLAADEKAPELLFLRGLYEEEAELSAPMTSAHGRGTELVAVQPYVTDADGRVSVLFRQAGTAFMLCGGAWMQTEIQAGEQSLEWMIS
ncbi:MAG: hypothetical protein IJ705_05010 [Oscillospiraceae bacterium]|nr:hypothetical protein [Oscillospiraceae bacterium]